MVGLYADAIPDNGENSEDLHYLTYLEVWIDLIHTEGNKICLFGCTEE